MASVVSFTVTSLNTDISEWFSTREIDPAEVFRGCSVPDDCLHDMFMERYVECTDLNGLFANCAHPEGLTFGAPDWDLSEVVYEVS